MRVSKTWKPSLLCSVRGHRCPQHALGPRRLSIPLGDYRLMALIKVMKKLTIAQPLKAEVYRNPVSAAH